LLGQSNEMADPRHIIKGGYLILLLDCDKRRIYRKLSKNNQGFETAILDKSMLTSALKELC
jgi:hypothetical protein